MEGRRAFETSAGIWPEAADNPRNLEDYRDFARTMNALPKVVVPKSLTGVGRNARVESGPITEVVERVKAAFDGEIVAVGGMALVSSLTKAAVVDRYRFPVLPQFAGRGRSLFDGFDAVETKLRLVSDQTMDTGALLLDYLPR